MRLHIVDRGASGDPLLRWIWTWEVPFLTIGHKGPEPWRFRAPTLRNEHALPITVRPYRRLGGDAADGPWEVIVPGDPDDAEATKAICFRSAVAFTEAELRSLSALHKSRVASRPRHERRGGGAARSLRRRCSSSRSVSRPSRASRAGS